jgi:hypothetical protein
VSLGRDAPGQSVAPVLGVWEARLCLRGPGQAQQARAVLPVELCPGKSGTRLVRPGCVPRLKKELATYKRFRKLTQALGHPGDRLSELRLEARRQAKR